MALFGSTSATISRRKATWTCWWSSILTPTSTSLPSSACKRSCRYDRLPRRPQRAGVPEQAFSAGGLSGSEGSVCCGEMPKPNPKAGFYFTKANVRVTLDNLALNRCYSNCEPRLMKLQTNRLMPLFVCLIFLRQSGSSDAQIARLAFQSDTGHYIGRGLNYDLTYTPSNGAFFSASVSRTLPSGEPAQFTFLLGGGRTPFSFLSFGTDQLGIPIQPGFYPGAERAAFATIGHAGLDLGFDGYGCNAVSGNFTISDLSFGPANSIQRFAASFEHHCQGWFGALSGTFRFAAVPEPSALSLSGCGGVAALACSILRKRQDRYCLKSRGADGNTNC